MGAATSAFFGKRYVVLAEGHSETILLPTLLREATEVDALLYQVAPGLAQMSAADPDREFHGSRVAYAVDGDGAGDVKLKQLTDVGVDKSRIAQLTSITLENVLDPTRYAEAVLAVAKRLGYDGPGPTMPAADAQAWPAVVDTWWKAVGTKSSPLKKTDVALELVETSGTRLSKAGKTDLRKLDKTLRKSLGLV